MVLVFAPSTIAATSTLAMVRTAAARGIDGWRLVAEAGLARDVVKDPDARIPASTVLALWQALRERTRDPSLQLAAPASLPFGAYRVIDYLVAASATVGDGLQRFARFFGLIADDLALTVEQEGDAWWLCLATAGGAPVSPVYVDYVFAALVSRIRMRIRPDLVVARVELRQPEPQDPVPYRDLFRSPIRFGSATDRLGFAAAEWSAPTMAGDALLVALLEEHARILAQRVPAATSGFARDVERAIAALLPESGSARAVARALNVSVRTLQRRLIASGTTFRHVAETVRARLAEGYLADPNVSVSEVAFLLGFSEQSAFNRAFRRWTGESPGRWRRQRSTPSQAGRSLESG